MLTALSLHATTLFTLICWRQWLSKNLVISWKGLNCLWLFDHWWAETFCPLRLNNTYKIPKNAWYESLNELTFQEVKLSCIPTDHLILFYDCFNKWPRWSAFWVVIGYSCRQDEPYNFPLSPQKTTFFGPLS